MQTKVLALLFSLSLPLLSMAQTSDFGLAAGTSVELGFNTISGKHYLIQQSSSVSPTTWSNVGKPIQGDGKRNYTLTRIRNNQMLYRVVEYDLNVGLIAYYPFNGNASDRSSNANNGVVTGATLVSDRFGNINSAYAFNGTNQYIQCPNQSYLNFGSGDVSISMWVYLNNNATDRFFIGKSDGQFNQNKWIAYYSHSPTQFSFHQNTTSGNSTFSGSANWLMDSNSWHHLVTTKSSGNYTTYIDGVKAAQSTGPQTIPSTSSPMTIGMVENTGWMSGRIDDIRIYNRALNSDEVSILNSETKVDIENGLMAYYSFTGNANDSTTNSNNGLVIKASLAPDRFGNVDRAYSFNGIDALIQIQSKPYLNLADNEATVAFWAKFDGTSTTRHVLGKSDGPFNQNKWIFYYSTFPDRISLHVNRISGGSTFSAPTPFSYDTTSWHHFAITKSGTTFTSFIDGIPTAQGSGPSQLPATSAYFTIGSVEGLSWFKGSLDEIRIYNRALTLKEIQALTSYDQ
jgi:hypothetical protein